MLLEIFARHHQIGRRGGCSRSDKRLWPVAAFATEDSLMAETWEDYKKAIIAHEGEVTHMYLDTAGYVTVGIGFMLPNVAEAQKLPFVNRATNQKATAQEIKTDYESVAKQAKGMIASRYKPFTKLDLPSADIRPLFDAKFESFKAKVVKEFPDFESYPLSVQAALMDMAFNLGMPGLPNKFPSFTRAIKARDFQTAAKESHRRGIQESRNATVKRWLESAATTTATPSYVGWNLEAAVRHLQNNAQPRSVGQCARYTRQAIEAGGVRLTRQNSAKDYGPSLEAVGFVKLASPPTEYLKGDVVIMQSFTGHPHGHMQMYDGTQWISDFKQRDFWPGQSYRTHKPSYAVYRFQTLQSTPPTREWSNSWMATPLYSSTFVCPRDATAVNMPISRLR